MAEVYVAIGSNIAPDRNIPLAVRKLAARFPLTGSSAFYRSRAVGIPQAPDFINGMVRLTVKIPPREFKFKVLRKIERSLGRRRTRDKNAPRTIDLDLVLYGRRVIRSRSLTLPDPALLDRDFLYVPLLDIDARLVLPGSGKSLARLVGTHARPRLKKRVRLSAAIKRLIQTIVIGIGRGHSRKGNS